MVRSTTSPARPGLVPALALLAAAFCLGTVQAQAPRPPFMPPGGGAPGAGPFGRRPGGMGGPLFEHVWTCGKCGREVSRGDFPPGSCPFCGVKFVNGIGGPEGFNNGGNNPAPAPNPNPNPGPGMMPPNMQPNNPGNLIPPGNNPQPAQPPQGMPGAAPNPGGMPPPPNMQRPDDGNVVNDPPVPDQGPAAPLPGDNAAAGGPPVNQAASASAARLSGFSRAVLGLAAVLAALVLIVVAVIVVYHVVASNQETARPARRRKRRRLAEEYS